MTAAVAPLLAAGAALAVSLAPADGPLVLAEVGPRRITVAEMADQLSAMSPVLLSRYREAAGRAELLDTLVRATLLALEAERRGLSAEPAVVRARKQAAIERLLATLDAAARAKLLADASARASSAGVVVHAPVLATLSFDPPAAPGAPRDLGERAAEVVAEAATEGGVASVLLGDLQTRLDALPPAKRETYRPDKGRARLVREALEFELLAAAALARGLGEDPAVVRAVRDELAAALLRREVPAVAPDAIPDKVARAWFFAHEAEFDLPATRRAAHFVVSDEALARRLAAELRGAEPGPWAAAARAHGVAGDGDLGFFTRDGRPWSPGARPAHTGPAATLVPPVAPAAVVSLAWTLAGPADTGVVKTAAGWHVVRLVLSRKAAKLTFDEVADRCRSGAAIAARESKLSALLAAARKSAKVATHPELLDRIVVK